MKNIIKLGFVRIIAVFLVVLFFQTDIMVFADYTSQNLELLSLVKKYNLAEYNEVITEINSKLNGEVIQKEEIRGKMFLLLGASYEQTGEYDKAAENYLLGDMLLSSPEIENVDLKSLEIFKKTILGEKVSGLNSFEKIGKRKKKKKFPILALVSGVALVVVVLLLRKKKLYKEEVPRSIKLANEIFEEIQWQDIPSGEFLMGDNYGLGNKDELPVHTVYLDSFKMSKFEITFSQYQKYCEANNLSYPDDEGWGLNDRPVINVSWDEVNGFCNWLKENTGKNIKLPTEAQWERAARGSMQLIYPWGFSEPDCNRVNYNNCIGKTELVGINMLDSSDYRVRNMGGNVAEFVYDYYSKNYYSISPRNNPTGPDPGESYTRVVRGGDWQSNDCRASKRAYLKPNLKNNRTGFRIVWIDG